MGVFAACHSSSSAPDARAIADAPPDTSLAATCQSLSDAFDAAIAKGRGACTTDADCDVLGGQFADWYCDGRPSIGDCAGTPIAKNAPGYADAAHAAHDFFASCFDSRINGIFDCAPRQGPTCQPNGYCTAPVVGSCFPPPPDAGVTTDAS